MSATASTQARIPAARGRRVSARRRRAGDGARIHARARSRTACAARPRSSTPTRSRGPTRTGRALCSTTRRSTSSTSARSPRRDIRRRRSRISRACASSGVTAVELMPVATFPGERGWGYDGLYSSMRRTARTAGPTGSRASSMRRTQPGSQCCSTSSTTTSVPGNEALRAFGPYFTSQHETFWGDAIDYSQAAVREWAIQNAELWVRDYHIDGLRLDAVHAIFDDSPRAHLRRARRASPGCESRARSSSRRWRSTTGGRSTSGGTTRSGPTGLHHELHVLLTGEQDGYYAGFGSVVRLARGSPGAGTRPTPARRLRAEPRPGRQPRPRRPAAARRVACGRGRDALLGVHAAALHGRRVVRAASVPVLHRSHRPGDRRGDARRAQAGVRGVRRLLRRGGPGPAVGRDVRPVEALPRRARPALSRVARAQARAAA